MSVHASLCDRYRSSLFWETGFGPCSKEIKERESVRASVSVCVCVLVKEYIYERETE